MERAPGRITAVLQAAFARAVALAFGAASREAFLDLCPEEARVLAVGAHSPWLVRVLRSHGRMRCMGVVEGGVPPSRAELLVLTGAAGRHLWRFGDYWCARRVAWAPGAGRGAALGALGLARHALRRRLRVRGAARMRGDDGGSLWCVVADVRPPAALPARRYISPSLGVRGFFEALDVAGVRYCVLRWFEGLPEVAAGEDLDLLVDDASLERVEEILGAEPGTIPVDLYSVSGLPGSAYEEMAYYPPALARRLLERAVRTPAGVWAPCPEDHFHSLAYHALYHKGERSGIPARKGAAPWGGKPEHDYAGVLTRLAHTCGIDVEITLDALDAHLARAGWRPPEDMLTRLVARNDWLRDRLARTVPAKLDEWDGLAVFFIRERAVELGLEGEVVRRLRAEGFHVLRHQVLDAEAAERVAARVRGGNWGRGPWPVSGGGPASVVVACDLIPIAPDAAQRRRFPTLDNARLLVKSAIREALNDGLPPEMRCNMLHSSDNHVEALRYLETALPAEVDAVRQELEALRERFRTAEPVRATLTRIGRRAKVEVVAYGDGLAVKKTFRPGCERFLEREVLALRTFGGVVPEVPPLLEAGDDYVIYPYYADARTPDPEAILPLSVVHRVLRAVRTFHEHGFAHVDLSPSNLLLGPGGEVKIIDFEFMHRYRERPPVLERCYELAGLPEDFDGDRPDWGATDRGGWDALWRHRVGLELKSLLRDPPWLQQLKQWRYRAVHAPIRKLRALVLAAVLPFAAAGCDDAPTGGRVGLPPDDTTGAGPDTVTLAEAYMTVRDGALDIDSPIAWRAPDGSVWLLVTAKQGDAVLIHDAATGALLRRLGREGDGAGEFDRPNGIAATRDVLLVVERDNRRVQAFTLPALEPLGSFGRDVLIRPYGITIVERDGALDVYVTDQPEGDPGVAEQLATRVKHFRVRRTGHSVEAELVRAFGDVSGAGSLRVVESIAADPEHGRLLIADERSKDINVYTLDGEFTGTEITGYFSGEPEGIALFRCGADGYWILADQHAVDNTFHVFERVELDYLGAFRGRETRNTDGIAVIEGDVGPLAGGAFFAVHDDGNVAAFSWRSIAEALELDVCPDAATDYAAADGGTANALD